MTDTQTDKCSGSTYDPSGFGNYYPCQYKAKMQHEGKGYCGVHDPVRRKEKRAAQSAKWRQDFAARMKHSDEQQHKLDAYPALLDALQQIASGAGEFTARALARAAIEKATGGAQ